MDRRVLVLLFVSMLKLGSCFQLVDARKNYGDMVDANEFPFEKSKVKYHRSRYCITVLGDTNCVRMSEEPGDASKIAKLYKMWMSGYEQDPDYLLRSMLDINNHIKQRKLIAKNKQAKLSQMVKKGKLRQMTNRAKLSQMIKQAKLSHKTNRAKLSDEIKEAKLKKKVEQIKMKWLSSFPDDFSIPSADM